MLVLILVHDVKDMMEIQLNHPDLSLVSMSKNNGSNQFQMNDNVSSLMDRQIL